MNQSIIYFCEEEDGEKFRIWQEDGEDFDEILMTREVAINIANEILACLSDDDVDVL